MSARPAGLREQAAGGAGSRGSSAVCRAPGENRQLSRALWAGNTPAPPRDTPLPPPPQRPTGMGCAVLFRSPPCSPFCLQRRAGTNSSQRPGTAPHLRHAPPRCAGPPTSLCPITFRVGAAWIVLMHLLGAIGTTPLAT